jgi:hypothetical protein
MKAPARRDRRRRRSRLATLLAMRALVGHRVESTLISPEREFLYRPVTVAEAFGARRGELLPVARE